MDDRLFLRLTGDDSAVWLRVERSGLMREARHGLLSEATADAAGLRVIVLAPACEVLLTEAAVPAPPRKQAQQAVPYMLEEQLATDVESLHFALGERSAEGHYATAVVARARMDAWLTRLEQAAIEPGLLVSELHALPWLDGQWTLLYTPSAALLRSGARSGFALDPDNLHTLLSAALIEAGEQKPAALRVINYSAHDPGLRDLATTWGFELQEQARHDDPLALFAQHFDETNAINLLQGDYSRTGQLGKLWRPWRLSAALLGVCLAFQVGVMLFDAVRLTQQSRQLKAEAEQVLRGAFPDARLTGDLRQLMESKLKELRRQRQGSAFLDLLAGAAMPLKQNPDVKLRGISYKEQVLNLDIEIKDLQALDQLKQQLAGAALAVEILSAQTRENRVESRLQVRNQKT
jgi:general secretion pathway protein L